MKQRNVLISIIFQAFLFASVYSQNLDCLSVFTIENCDADFLYRNIENRLSIKSSLDESHEIFIESNVGTVKRVNNTFSFHTAYGSKVVFSIYKIKNGDTLLLGSKTYRLLNIPDPLVLFGGKSSEDTTIDLVTLRAANGLTVTNMYFVYDRQYRIVSYLLKSLTQPEIVYKSERNVLTREMRDFISSLNTGDKIIFSEILVLAPDNQVIEVPPIELRIVAYR